MHQTRAAAVKRLPLPRKGTKYLVRTRDHPSISVPVLIALRDMIHIAKDLREVKHLIHKKEIKINGRVARDYREAIKLFSLLHAGKTYRLTLNTSGKFVLEESKDKDRLCKVIGKRLVSGNKAQVTLHDGTNILNDKVSVGDSVILDEKNKVVKILKFEKGKKIMIMNGKNAGKGGEIVSIKEDIALIDMGGRETALKLSNLILI